MSELELVQGSDRWKALRRRALSDLFWFNDVVLGHGSVVPMTLRTHYLLCRFAERRTGVKALDECHVRMIQMPRESGKTTLITQGYAIQLACRDPNTSVLIVNENIATANAMLTSIKRQFESNEFLRALFPEAIPEDFKRDKWSEIEANLQRTTTRKDPTFFTVGVEGTRTGMHPDHIICDDMISREAMESARAGNWSIMEKVNRWVHQLIPLVNKGCPDWQLLTIGTRWWRGDSYEHIEEAFAFGQPKTPYALTCALETGDSQTVTAYRRGDIAVFIRSAIENGQSSYPEKWSLEDLAKIRVMDPALFAANYLNDPTNEATATFKSDWLKYYDHSGPETYHFVSGEGKHEYLRLDQLDRVMMIDPAFGGNAGVSRAGLVLTGSTGTGQHLLLEAKALKVSTDTLIKEAAALIVRYRPRKLVLERIAQQAAFILLMRQAIEQANVPVVVEEVTPGTRIGGMQKEVRIMGLEPYFQRGLLLVHRSQSDFHEEYQSFPRGRYMDLLDALAYLPPFWLKTGVQTTSSPELRKERELQALYSRMGKGVPLAGKLSDEAQRLRPDGSKRW